MTSPFNNSNILISGLARNCSHTVNKSVLKILAAFNQAREIHWLVIESDSTDDTVKNLNRLSEQIPSFRYISLGSLRVRMPRRTDRIAACRNVYLKELTASGDKFDFLIVADLDGINDGLTPESVASCGARLDWDVCAANQAGPYYDIWALRHGIWSPNDCNKQFYFYRRHGHRHFKALKAAVHSRMITVGQEEPWLPVDSAFGGLAIYRVSAIGNATYVGLDDDGSEICEHVTFHAQLRARGARIFINPKLINAGYTEHTKPLRFWPAFLARIFYFLRMVRNLLRKHRKSKPEN